MNSKSTLGIASCCILTFSGCVTEKNNTPNIIYINIDDLGWKDTDLYGNTFYETPNIDKLASQGMLFTNAYASAANCAPSRACLMTGLNTPRHGIYTVGSSKRGKSIHRKLIPTPNTIFLDTAFITFPEQLQKAGYKTISIGKWHLSDDACDHGFDINIAGTKIGHPKSYFSPYKNKNLEDGPEGEYLTDRLTDEAIYFIQKNNNEKFFLYLPYFTIHTPLQGKEDLIEKYKIKAGDSLYFNPTYAAMVEAMDQNIGRILNALDEMKLSDNTLIIFTSDNGGVNAFSSQKPLRAGKGSYYEGGIREPLIIKWPGKINPGSSSDIPVSNIDFYPTLMEIADIKLPENIQLDGQSILPLLRNTENFNTDRPLYWHFPIYLQAVNKQKDDGRDPLFRTRPGSVILKGNYKLHEYFEDNALELYNLEIDPGERNNLASQMPEKADELYNLLIDWRSKTNAHIPTELNPEYMEK